MALHGAGPFCHLSNGLTLRRSRRLSFPPPSRAARPPVGPGYGKGGESSVTRTGHRLPIPAAERRWAAWRRRC